MFKIQPAIQLPTQKLFRMILLMDICRLLDYRLMEEVMRQIGIQMPTAMWIFGSSQLIALVPTL